METNQARLDLAAWDAARPTDWSDEPHLRALNRRHVDAARLTELEGRAGRLGRGIAAVRHLISRYEHRDHLPRLERWDAMGRRIESIEFDPAYHEVGRIVWESGVVASAGRTGSSFDVATMLYVVSHEGEMGHGCPAVCTVGLIRALRRKGSEELVDRWLPPLLDTDYDTADRGAQYLTEVQGGSDVGSNLVRAEPVGDGTYRIYGEKWFCSVADADQFLVTARPEGAGSGTTGLGCFLVPRLVDGEPNGFAIRRLKEKLGTRAMASAEIDFEGAVAFPIGPLDEGFKTTVSAMLNASRWLNAVGNCGMMRRAYVEAVTYAGVRSAFGRRIGDFPMVRAQLAGLKLEWLAALYGTWHLTALDEAVDTGAPGEDDEAMHRFLVNANKYLVSTRATAAVLQAIEILGGNGAIESFSALPRMLRDAIVYEQWEGTHNVLAAQVRRDMGKLGLAGVVFERLSRMVKGVSHPELGEAAARASAALDDLGAAVQRSLVDAAFGDLHFRAVLGRMVRAVQAAVLLDAADSEPDAPLAAELRAAADLFARLHLDPSYDPEADRDFADRNDAILTEL